MREQRREKERWCGRRRILQWMQDFFFPPSNSTSPSCHPALFPRRRSLTEDSFKERLVAVRQGWAWKRRIVRSHSSQTQAGAKSVAVGITPMNHAHCDAYPGWEHGKELGIAEPYQFPIRNRSAARSKQPFPSFFFFFHVVFTTVEFLHCHVLLLKDVQQPSYCALFHPRPSSCLCTSFPPIYPEIFVVGPGVQAILGCTS